MALVMEQRSLVADDGERFSILLGRQSEQPLAPAQPLFRPNVFLIAMRRSAGLASNSLLRDGQALMHGLVWADQQRIDLEARFARGEFLTPREIQRFARAAKVSFKDLSAAPPLKSPPRKITSTDNVEQFRAPSARSESGVKPETSSFKIWLFRQYVDWLADDTARSPASQSYRTARATEKQAMLAAFDAQITKFSGTTSGPREGITEAEQSLLLEVIQPGSGSNPWVHPFVQVRNQLLIELLLDEGIRKGESLKQRINNINFTDNTIDISRRPDDPSDPRVREPNVKRAGRVLPMGDHLSNLLSDYIVNWRSKLKNARSHDILFVNKDGEPLSGESVQKMFSVLRRRHPQLPKDLAAHLLRHTWNDNFTITMDKNRVSAEHEMRDRSYLMGWKPSSTTAARYTARSRRMIATKHSLQTQEARHRKKQDE